MDDDIFVSSTKNLSLSERLASLRQKTIGTNKTILTEKAGDEAMNIRSIPRSKTIQFIDDIENTKEIEEKAASAKEGEEDGKEDKVSKQSNIFQQKQHPIDTLSNFANQPKSLARFDQRRDQIISGQYKPNKPKELLLEFKHAEKPLQLLQEKTNTLLESLDDQQESILHHLFKEYSQYIDLCTKEFLLLLIEKTSKVVSIKSNEGHYPLTLAMVHTLDIDILWLLLKYYPQICQEILSIDTTKKTLLLLALENNLIEPFIQQIINYSPSAIGIKYFNAHYNEIYPIQLVIERQYSLSLILQCLRYDTTVLFDKNEQKCLYSDNFQRILQITVNKYHKYQDIMDFIQYICTLLPKDPYSEENNPLETTPLKRNPSQATIPPIYIFTQEFYFLLIQDCSDCFDHILYFIQNIPWVITKKLSERMKDPIDYLISHCTNWSVLTMILTKYPQDIIEYDCLAKRPVLHQLFTKSDDSFSLKNRTFLLSTHENTTNTTTIEEKQQVEEKEIKLKQTLALSILQQNPSICQIPDKFLSKYTLSYAISCTNHVSSELLIQQIVQLNISLIQNYTNNHIYLLHELLASSQIFSVSYLFQWIEQYPEMIRVTDKTNGSLPIHYAVEKKEYYSIVQRLLEIYPESIRMKNAKGLLPLHCAYSRSYSFTNQPSDELLQLLIEKYPESIQLSFHGKDNCYPLHLSVHQHRSSELIQRMIEIYPLACQTMDDMAYPLHYAVSYGASLPILNLLLTQYPEAIRMKTGKKKYEFKEDILLSNSLPIMLALLNPTPLEVINRLIDLYSEPIRQLVEHGMTLLHYLLEFFPDRLNVEGVQALINNHKEMTKIQDDFGRYPLHYAAKGKSPEIVTLILQAFPEAITITDKDNLLPIHLQIKSTSGSSLVMKVLAESKPSTCLTTTTSQAFMNMTPLQYQLQVVSMNSEENLYVFLDYYPPIYEMNILTKMINFHKNPTKLLIKVIQRRIQDILNKKMNFKYAMIWHDILDSSFAQKKTLNYTIKSTKSSDFESILDENNREINKMQIVDEILTQYSTIQKELCYGKDWNGRECIQIVDQQIKQQMLKHLLFCGRFELQLSPIIHKSSTSLVIKAIDHCPQEDWQLQYQQICQQHHSNHLTFPLFLQLGQELQLFSIEPKKELFALQLHDMISIYDLETKTWIYGLILQPPSSLSIDLRTASPQILSNLSILIQIKHPIHGNDCQRYVQYQDIQSRDYVEISQLFQNFDVQSKGYLLLAEFVQCCYDHLSNVRSVVLKFMKHEDQYLRELECREIHHLPDNLSINNSKHNSLKEHLLPYYQPPDPILFAQTIQTMTIGDQSLRHYPYCLVMPEADRNLDSIRRFERPGVDIIRMYFRDIASSLACLHQHGIMHGDIKLLNAIRLNNRIQLIDLDASSPIDTGFVGAKFSSGILPPEMFVELTVEEVLIYERYWAKIQTTDPELWKKVRPVPIGENKYAVVKTYLCQKDGEPILSESNPLPYELVRASAAIDAWSYGVMLFSMFAQCPLLLVSYDDDLVPLIPSLPSSSTEDLKTNKKNNRFRKIIKEIQPIQIAMSWTKESIGKQLEVIEDLLARDLLIQLLHPNPKERLQDMEKILQHPFFNPTSASPANTMLSMMKTIDEKMTTMSLDVKESVTLLQTNQEMLQSISITVTKLEHLSHDMLERIDRTKHVLLKGLIEAQDVIVPSCFVIVNQKLSKSADNDNNNTTSQLKETEEKGTDKLLNMQDKANQWITRLSSFYQYITNPTTIYTTAKDRLIELFKGEQTLYLYLIDEATMQPVIPNDDSDDCYPIPIEITTQSERIANVLPLLKVSLNALSMLNSVSGLARCLGYPTPCIPQNILNSLSSSITSLDEPSSIAEYDRIQSLVLANELHHTNNENNNENNPKIEHVRGLALRQLDALLLEHDPKRTFAGLQRIIPANSSDGKVLWTTEEGMIQLEQGYIKGMNVEKEIQTDNCEIFDMFSSEQQLTQEKNEVKEEVIEEVKEEESKETEEPEEEGDDETEEGYDRMSYVKNEVFTKLNQAARLKSTDIYSNLIHVNQGNDAIQSFERKTYPLEVCLNVIFTAANVFFGTRLHNVARPRRFGHFLNFAGKINLRKELLSLQHTTSFLSSRQKNINKFVSGTMIVQVLKKCVSSSSGECLYYKLTLHEWEELFQMEASSLTISSVQSAIVSSPSSSTSLKK